MTPREAEASVSAIHSPSLCFRMTGDGIRPRLVAVQVVAVQRTLVRANFAAIAAGRTADGVNPAAAADADIAFALLSNGY